MYDLEKGLSVPAPVAAPVAPPAAVFTNPNTQYHRQDDRPTYHRLAASSEVERFKNRIRQDVKAKKYEALQEKNAKGATFLASLIDNRHKNDDCYVIKLEITLKSKLPDEIIKYLLTNEDKDGFSAMEKAAFLGKTEFLNLMVNRYCELLVSDYFSSKPYPVSKEKRRTLLHSAACGGYSETCEFILNKWPDIIDEQDIDGHTALHMASTYKHDEVIVLLLQRNASFLLMNKLREPAFVYAMCSESAKENLLQRFNDVFKFSDAGPYSAKRDTVIFSLNSLVPRTASVDSNDTNSNPIIPTQGAKPTACSSPNTSTPSEPSAGTNYTNANPIVLTEEAKPEVISSPSTNDTDAIRTVKTKEAESEPLIQTGVTTKNKNVTTVRETEVLAKIVKVKLNVTQDFLLHPLCKTFVELKMQRLRLFCILEVILYLFYVCIFTSLSICREAVSTTVFSNNTTSENNLTASSYNSSSDIFGLQIATTILAGLKVITHFCLLIYYVNRCRTKENYVPARNKRSKTKYRVPFLHNIAPLIIHITTIVVTWLAVEDAKYVIPFVLLLHWYWLIYKLEVFEYSGKYVMMLNTVLVRFFKLFLTFLPIYIGFALAFSGAFKDVALLKFPVMLMTGFSMMVGEHNSNHIFEKNQVEFTSSIVLIAFIIVLGIVVMNLLVGLTVADTTLLEKEGEARLVVQNLKRINIAEEIAEFIEKSGFPYISKQLSLLPRDNSEDTPRKKSLKNPLMPGEIILSLKDCDKSDLLYIGENEKSPYSWLRRQCEYYLYAICGVVLYNTVLYRKYPIHEKFQAEVEVAAMKTSKA